MQLKLQYDEIKPHSSYYWRSGFFCRKHYWGIAIIRIGFSGCIIVLLVFIIDLSAHYFKIFTLGIKIRAAALDSASVHGVHNRGTSQAPQD